MGGVREEERRREKIREEKESEEEEEDAGRQVAIHCVLPLICGSGGSQSRLAKAASAEPSG